MNVEINHTEKYLNEKISPNGHIFIYLSIINFFIAYLADQYIFSREFYYTIFSDQMELTRIDQYVDLISRFSFWSLFLVPVFLFVRYTVVAFLLQIPLLFMFIEISFKYLFRWVMLASIFLTIGDTIHLLNIYFTSSENITPTQFMITPFSLATIINPQAYASLAILILNHFNLFDILWGITLYIGLLKTAKLNKINTVLLVAYVWIFFILVELIVVFFLENF